MKDQDKIDDGNLNERLRSLFLEENSQKADESPTQFILNQEYNVKIDGKQEQQLLKKLSKISPKESLWTKGFGYYLFYSVLSIVGLGLLAGLLYFTKDSNITAENTSFLESIKDEDEKSLIPNTVPSWPDSSDSNAGNSNYNVNEKKGIAASKAFEKTVTNSDSTKTSKDTLALTKAVKKNNNIVKKEPVTSIETLAELPVGQSIVFHNLYFQPGSSFLTYESAKKELPKLLKIMKENPKLKIEIQGHITAVCKNCKFGTDDKDVSYLKPRPLSVTRAKYIYDDLVRKGIDPDRMTYVGYGNTKPLIIPEITEADREKNRRVEIKVVASANAVFE